MTGRMLSRFTAKSDCTSGTPLTNASLWAHSNNWSFTGIHQHLQGIFPRIWQSFDVIFAECALSSAVCCFRAPSVAILTSLRPAVNPLLGCSSGKPCSRPIGVRVCPVARHLSNEVASRRQQRSRSRERAPAHVPPHAGQQLQPFAPPLAEQQIQPLAIKDADDESAAVEPQIRVSDCSRSPQRKESPQRQKGKKNTAEVKKPRDLPKAKKHKPLDSDEDDEGPRNEPGTSSNTQPPVPVFSLQSRSTSSSHGPSTSTTSTSSQRTSTSTTSEDEYTEDEDDEYGDVEFGPAIQSARSHDSGRTVLYPELHVLTNDEHWTVTPETHKYAAAAGSFCFVTTENGEEQDVCNLTTMPCVQRSLCLDENELTVKQETCWNAVWPPVEKQQEQGPRWDLVHEKKHQLRKYEDITNSLLKRTSWVQILGWQWGFWSHWREEGQTEELCDRTMGAHHQDWQAGQLLQGKGQMGT